MSNRSRSLEGLLQRCVVSLVDRNLLIINTVPGSIGCGGVTGIYVAHVAGENLRRRLTRSDHLYLKVSTSSGWNLDGSGLRDSRGPISKGVTAKGRQCSNSIVVTELDDARLDLIIAEDAIAFRPEEASIVTKDSGLSVRRKKKSLDGTRPARMVAYVGASALNCRCDLLDTGARQIHPFR